jgi:hypothetical protein
MTALPVGVKLIHADRYVAGWTNMGKRLIISIEYAKVPEKFIP